VTREAYGDAVPLCPEGRLGLLHGVRDERVQEDGLRLDRQATGLEAPRHFPDSHVVAFPHLGHSWSGVGGCIDPVVTDFLERGTTKGLETTGSDGVVVVPPFPLTSCIRFGRWP